MSSIIPAGQTPFESIRHTDEHGNEYWTARELMLVLGYEQWRNFQSIVKEARQIYVSQGGKDTDGVFAAIAKNSAKSGGRPSAEYDYLLSRHACYLVAMSAEGSKSQVAAAKTYFAVMTREQELTQQGEEKVIRAYMSKGYSQEWAIERVKSIVGRAQLTKAWDERGGGAFYDLLTEILHTRSLDIGTQEHMALKGFAEGKDGRYKGPLRDALTIRELAIVSFTQSMAHAEHEENDSHGIGELQRDCEVAGDLGKKARLIVEDRTGRRVVSSRNMITDPDGGIFGDLGPADEQQPEEGC